MKHVFLSSVAVAIVALVGTVTVLAAEPAEIGPAPLPDSPFQEEALFGESSVGDDAGVDQGLGECGSCDCCLWYPRWSVTAGAVFLRRSDAPERVMVEDAYTREELINTSDLNLDWGTGPRVDIVRHLNSECDLQALFFCVDSWNAQAWAESPYGLIIPLFDDAFTFDAVKAHYRSRLYSLEFNLRQVVCYRQCKCGQAGCGDDCCEEDCCQPCCCKPWLRVLAGFRWIELHDQAFFWSRYTVEEVDPFQWGKFNCDNSLHGFQLGAEAVLWDRGGRLQVDGFLKGGVYGNRVHRTGFATGDLGTRNIGDIHCRTAFAGEVGLTMTYRLTRRLSAMAGYEALWIDGVALAPMQEKDKHIYDTAFYHGALVGLQGRW